MGCCGGHYEMHDDRDRRVAQAETRGHSEGPSEGRGVPPAPARPEEGSLNRWTVPLVVGIGVLVLYFILR